MFAEPNGVGQKRSGKLKDGGCTPVMSIQFNGWRNTSNRLMYIQ